MTVFARATDLMFRDPNMAADGVWRAGGSGPPRAVRVILNRPDLETAFGEGRFVTDTVRIDVRVAEIADLNADDTIAVGSEIFAIRGEPMRDALRLVWKAEARRL